MKDPPYHTHWTYGGTCEARDCWRMMPENVYLLGYTMGQVPSTQLMQTACNVAKVKYPVGH